MQTWSKTQSSIMLEDYEEFISLTLRTRSLKKPSGMLERNWKHQWLPLCLARHARKVRKGRPEARLMISRSPASWGRPCMVFQQHPSSQSLLVKLGFLGSQSTVPGQNPISQCPLVKLGLPLLRAKSTPSADVTAVAMLAGEGHDET